MAVGMLGLLCYYAYQRGSPGDNNGIKVTLVRSVETRANKFEMESSPALQNGQVKHR